MKRRENVAFAFIVLSLALAVASFAVMSCGKSDTAATAASPTTGTVSLNLKVGN